MDNYSLYLHDEKTNKYIGQSTTFLPETPTKGDFFLFRNITYKIIGIRYRMNQSQIDIMLNIAEEKDKEQATKDFTE